MRPVAPGFLPIGIAAHETPVLLLSFVGDREPHMRLTPTRTEHGMTLHDTREPNATHGAAPRALRDANRHTQASRGSRRSAMTTAAFATLCLARAALTGQDVAA